jgi:hypothetical protein
VGPTFVINTPVKNPLKIVGFLLLLTFVSKFVIRGLKISMVGKILV